MPTKDEMSHVEYWTPKELVRWRGLWLTYHFAQYEGMPRPAMMVHLPGCALARFEDLPGAVAPAERYTRLRRCDIKPKNPHVIGIAGPVYCVPPYPMTPL